MSRASVLQARSLALLTRSPNRHLSFTAVANPLRSIPTTFISSLRFHIFSTLFIDTLPSSSNMDTLVARYTRPSYENEGYSEQDYQELSESIPSLSLKFALPPIAQVGACSAFHHVRDVPNSPPVALRLPPRHDRRLLEPKLPDQARARHHDLSLPLPGRHHRRDRLPSDGGQLDRQPDGQEGD